MEGPTDDPAVLELRARQRRNLIATLLLSEGVPLLLGGDEFARSQGGNSNAYCQDDELTWFDWSAPARPDDPFLVLLNAWWEPLEFNVPEPLRDLGWRIEVDTADPSAAGRAVDPSAAVPLIGRSLLLLRGTEPVS